MKDNQNKPKIGIIRCGPHGRTTADAIAQHKTTRPFEEMLIERTSRGIEELKVLNYQHYYEEGWIPNGQDRRRNRRQKARRRNR